MNIEMFIIIMIIGEHLETWNIMPEHLGCLSENDIRKGLDR